MIYRKIIAIGTLHLLGTALFTGCLAEEPSGPEVTLLTSPADSLSSTELTASSFLPAVPRISVEKVKVKLDAAANIVIVDSRSKASYDQVHIAGAISIPLADMTEPYDELAGFDEIIIYCN